jgi:hypothetical protein
MGNKGDYLENKILDHILGRTTYTAPATVYIALYTVAPGDTNSSGTEVGGTGYSRIAVPNTTDSWVNAANGQKTNAIDINFPVVGDNGWGTIVAFAICESAFEGNTLYWGLLDDPKDTEDGDTVSFPAGSLVVEED